jgi:hypothetical protein
MTAIIGTWKNGQIVLDEPADWPDGCRVIIEPVPAEEETIGIREEDWPTTAEAIAGWLTWFDSIEPVEWTPDEEADWRAWRQEIREYTITNMDKRVEGLFE